MANTKISELTAASTLTGSEILPFVQSGVTKRKTLTGLLTDFDVARLVRDGSDNVIGLQDAASAAIPGIASYTWAQFIALDPADYNGVYVRVTDKHSSPNGKGGSTFVGDSTTTAGWQLVSGPIYTTWAARPSPVTYSYIPIITTDVGIRNLRWVSNGTRHILESGTWVILSKINSPVTQTSLEVEQLMASVLIPNDGTKSILQNGDMIRVTEVMEKTGTTDKLDKGWRIGNDNAVTDTNIKTWDSTTVTNDVIAHQTHFERIAATTLRVIGAQAFASLPGTSAANPQADVTMSDNMDTCSGGGVYFSTTGFLIKSGGSLVDSACSLKTWVVEINTCGA